MNLRNCALAFTIILTGCNRDDGIARKAIIGGTAIDAKTRTEHSVLVVAGERILTASTTADKAIPASAERYDGRNKFVIPAFVKQPEDWPETPLTTYQEIDTRVNVEGANLVFGIVEDRVIEEYRWFDSMRQKAVVFIPRMSRLEPGSESYRIASQNLVKLAESDVSIAALAPRENPSDIFREFEALALAGMTPEQVLHAATLNASLALRQDDFGLLLRDKRASLLVLSANPIEDVANLRKIDRVMVNGNWADNASPFVN